MCNHNQGCCQCEQKPAPEKHEHNNCCCCCCCNQKKEEPKREEPKKEERCCGRPIIITGCMFEGGCGGGRH